MHQSSSNIKCLIIGGGGHAKVLIDTISSRGLVRIIGILDPEKDKWNTTILGIPIVGDDSAIPELVSQGANAFIVGVGSTGNNQLRRRLFELGTQYGLEPIKAIHINSICSEAIDIGPGSQVLPASIINHGSTIGYNVIINTGSIIEHDCIIESHSHIATGARLCGTVHIGENTHIGAGATILQNIRIGSNVIVGAGSVVLEDIRNNSIVAGVPAIPIK